MGLNEKCPKHENDHPSFLCPDAEEKIKKGVYWHFKGKDYLVLEVMILYIPFYGKFQMLVRPKAMFLEEVNRPECNYKGPRFLYVGEF